MAPIPRMTGPGSRACHYHMRVVENREIDICIRAYCYVLEAIPQTPDNPSRGLHSHPYPLETSTKGKFQRPVMHLDGERSFVGYLDKMTRTDIQFKV
ncbi:hypothetical protein K443DRAFT_675397 [Laccaria amethystina LaAM-08-1]|uniref:Unplaced genomic scaffold K443scaffold_28, whole genome shotgun sequence n=1 Tax=Laccaria amethystina LaAM-08-1 TaxID=1095629 RepID=A0A0C9WZ96_9AGAR|nr:hypothetical protein K443DRAFT_675397 [Laccaria amethystina LaAM-08-1]